MASGFGWWHRDRFLAWLGLLTPLGFVIATLAATRIVGPYETYLFFWAQILALPALISGLAGVSALVHRTAVLASAVTLAGAVAAVAVAVSVVARGATASYGDSPDARAAAAAIESAAGSSRQVVTLDIMRENFADGPLILALVKDGYHLAVVPEMDLYSGDTTRAGAGATFEVDTAAAPGAPPAGRHLITVGFLAVWEKVPG